MNKAPSHTHHPEGHAGGVDDEPGRQIKLFKGERRRAVSVGQPLNRVPQAGRGRHVHLPIHTFLRGARDGAFGHGEVLRKEEENGAGGWGTLCYCGEGSR